LAKTAKTFHVRSVLFFAATKQFQNGFETVLFQFSFNCAENHLDSPHFARTQVSDKWNRPLSRDTAGSLYSYTMDAGMAALLAPARHIDQPAGFQYGRAPINS